MSASIRRTGALLNHFQNTDLIGLHFHYIQAIIIITYTESYRCNKLSFLVASTNDSQKASQISEHLYQTHIAVTDKYPVIFVNGYALRPEKLTRQDTPGTDIRNKVSKRIEFLDSGVEHIDYKDLIELIVRQHPRVSKFPSLLTEFSPFKLKDAFLVINFYFMVVVVRNINIAFEPGGQNIHRI